MPDTTVTIAFEGNLSLKSFAAEINSFRGLIEALSSEVAKPAKITWLLDDLEYGSAIATVRGEAEDSESVERVVAAYATVGRALERHEPVPYSPRVVRQANQLVSLLNGEITAIRFQTPEEESTVLSPSLSSIASTPTLSAYGAVDGRVQTLSSRGGLRFTLYDVLQDKAVYCYLQEGQQEMMRGSWGRRALVEGWVTRDTISGRPITIRRVRSVELLTDVPAGSYRLARGILLRGSDDLPPEDAIRRLRDA